MNTSSAFSLQRFYLVLKRYMVLNQKNLLTSLAAISGLLLVLSLIQTYAAGGSFSTDVFSNTGMPLFFIFGFLLASGIFKELHSPARSQFFLTLPASSLEKVAAAWVISAPVYTLILYLALMLLSLLAALLASLIFGSAMAVFNPFTSTYLYIAGVYLVTHSIFFLGGVYFRKNNFLKTILSIFLFLMAIGMLGGLIFYLFFGTPGIQMDEQTIMGTPAYFEILPAISRIVFWGLLGPFFLIVSYFRFKEREV